MAGVREKGPSCGRRSTGGATEENNNNCSSSSIVPMPKKRKKEQVTVRGSDGLLYSGKVIKVPEDSQDANPDQYHHLIIRSVLLYS